MADNVRGGGCRGLVLMKSCLLVSAREGDAHPLGALPVGTLINNVESEPGRGAQYIRAAGMGTEATHIPQSGRPRVPDTTDL